MPAVYEPGPVPVLQGRKCAQLGDRVVHHDAMQCLLPPMTLLPRGQVLEASPAKPDVCLRLRCETQALAELARMSPSPFSCEYRRLFGAPAREDI